MRDEGEGKEEDGRVTGLGMYSTSVQIELLETTVHLVDPFLEVGDAFFRAR